MPGFKVTRKDNCKITSQRDRGERQKAKDKPFGIANCKSQMANLRSEIYDLRFLAEPEQFCGLQSHPLGPTPKKSCGLAPSVSLEAILISNS
jgi:hypothetical protein